MKLFDNISPTYATAANAEKKLRKVMGDTIDTNKVRWMIAVNSDGRFFPVVVHDTHHAPLVLAHEGICVVG